MTTFKDLKVSVLSGFSGFARLSGDVICRNISREGGVVISPKDIQMHLDELNCLIVPAESSLSKILETLSLKTLPPCNIVTPNWAIESIKSKRKLPFSDYLWIQMSIEIPAKREADAQISDSPSKRTHANIDITGNKSLGEAENLSVQVQPSPEMNRKGENINALADDSKLRKDLLRNRDKFSFSKERTNHNEHITSVLEILMNNYAMLRDKGRSMAYRFAIVSLQSYPEKITCAEQVQNLQKVGSKIKKKIAEILETGTLKRVKAMDEQGRLKSLKEFNKIWGIGATTAEKLYSLGYRSIQDLRANIPSILNENQRIGLELYEDFAERIPRQEVSHISDIVTSCAKELLPDKEITANTCGSYRRGKETAGDVDVLITFDGSEKYQGYLTRLVDVLKEKGLITHTLVLSEEPKKHESFTFEGVARLPGGLHRRLDIKVYPRKYYAWALMHFTGSANFNRSIRLFAKTKGLKLTDEGIFPAIRKNGETHCGASLIACYTEEDIFRLFDMPYKPPEQRDL